VAKLALALRRAGAVIEYLHGDADLLEKGSTLAIAADNAASRTQTMTEGS